MKKTCRAFFSAVLLLPLVFFLVAFFNSHVASSGTPPLIRVGISLTANHLVLSLENGDFITDQGSGDTKTFMSGTYRLENSSSGIRISDTAENSYGVFSGPLQLESERGTFKIGNSRYGSTYSGSLEIFPRGNSGLTAVNIVDMESYLRGVVPREIIASWGNYDGMEAIKAQAVAARTFALNHLIQGNHKNDPYDLCDTQHCQVYGGKDCETANTNRAVAETHGQILTWNGKPIEAFFHSNNGGYTECSANVWMTALPYLSSQPDPFDDPENRNLQNHPSAIWEKDIPIRTLNNLLAGGSASTVVDEVKIASVFSSERVNELRISGGGHTASFLKERARTVLGLRSQLYTVSEQPQSRVWIASVNKDGREIKESYAELEGKWIANSHGINRMLTGKHFSVMGAGGGDTVPYLAYIFKGRGWGHGIGMSQYGAYNRSRAGQSYSEILSFYYPGAELVNKY